MLDGMQVLANAHSANNGPSPKLGSDKASICFLLSILKVCRPVNSLLEEKVLEEEGDGVKPRRKYRTTKFDVADT